MAKKSKKGNGGQFFGGVLILAAGFYILHSATTAPNARLFQKASRGDADAQEQLAEHYEYGDGFDQNYEEAYFWYRLAANSKKGDADKVTETAGHLTKEQRDFVEKKLSGWKPMPAPQ